MAVNVRGYLLCTKYAIQSMLGRGGGAIVNTSSGAGMQGEVVRAAYGTSKTAIIGFTRSVATQYGKMGIRCNAVVPGMTMTETITQNVPPQLLEVMTRHTLTPTLAGPQDVANAVVFLASPSSAFITGIALPVDGGFSVHGPSYADEVAMWTAAAGDAAAAAVDRFRSALELRSVGTLDEAGSAQLAEAVAGDAVWHGTTADGWNALARGEARSRWSTSTSTARTPSA